MIIMAKAQRTLEDALFTDELVEQAVHAGLYARRDGKVDLSTLAGPGFGYRLEEIGRELPAPAAEFE